jgi:hypothetical protein
MSITEFVNENGINHDVIKEHVDSSYGRKGEGINSYRPLYPRDFKL